MTDNTQPEALRLAAWMREGAWHRMTLGDVETAGRELRRQHARIADLESQLESIGAGGVNGPLIGSAFTAADMPEGITRDDTVHGETYYTAADMATASAQGFRDGVASLGSNEGSIEGSSEGSEPAPALTQGAAIAAGSPVVKDSLTTDIAAVAVRPGKIEECYGDCPTDPKTCANPCNFVGRASHGQAPAQADDFGSAEHWKEKAQYWAGVAHRLRGEALRGEPVDGIIHPPMPSPQAAQQAPAGATDPWQQHMANQAEVIDCEALKRAMVQHGISFPEVGMEYFRASLGEMVNRFERFAAPAAPRTPASGGWISVDERLPDETQAYGCETDDCLVLLPNKRRALAMLVRAASGKKWLDQESRVVYPTHWRDVPASPTIEGESK